MRRFVIAFFIAAFLAGIARVGSSRASDTPPGKMRVASLDVLVPIYTAGMKPGEVEAVERGIDLARLFYWRNTACRLDLQLHYMPIEAAAPPTTGASYTAIEADLRARGVRDNQYAAIFTVADNLDGCWGGFTILGLTGAAYGHDCGVAYPLADPGVDTRATWAFTHEFGHVLDLVIAEHSGHPEMLFNHFPWIYPLPPGEVFRAGAHYDGMAAVLRRFNAYSEFKAPWNGSIVTDDADGDGFPDDDPRLAMDEKRFGSSPRMRDTDGDGLDDLGEFTAGIFSGTNPRLRDTDGDGIADGADPYPLDAIAASLPRAPAAPRMDGTLDPSWPLIATGLRYRSDSSMTASLYGSWDEGHLYLAVVASSAVRAHVSLDASPENGRFQTDGVFAGSGGSVETTWGDCWCDDAEITAAPGDPEVRAGAARIPGARVASGVMGSEHVLEMAIPVVLPRGANYTYAAPGTRVVNGLTLAEGRPLGLAVTLGDLERGAGDEEFSGDWASFFEPYRFDEITLGGASAAVIAAAPSAADRRLELWPASPNPTRGASLFRFTIPSSGGSERAVELALFDVHGRLVRTLVARALGAGTHEVRWDGRDTNGRMVSAGVYFARLSSASEVISQKLTLLR